MLRLHQELLRFDCGLLEFVLIYFIQSFHSASLSTQPQPVFVFLQFETSSDQNILKLSNEVLLREAKLNHVNTKDTRVYQLVKKKIK